MAFSVEREIESVPIMLSSNLLAMLNCIHKEHPKTAVTMLHTTNRTHMLEVAERAKDLSTHI